jgi:type IV pilus assembly protein PilY1
MNPSLRAVLAALLAAAAGSAAAQTDIARAPLATSRTDAAKPNLMFILDDSGSMSGRHMPDYIEDSNVDKPRRCGDGPGDNCDQVRTRGISGNPPWYSPQFNTLYYNPTIRYQPALDASGSAMTSYGSPWTAVAVNAFNSGAGTIDLVSKYPELVYCKDDDENDLDDSSKCKRNGIHTTNPFMYNTANAANGYPDGTGSNDNFRFPRTRLGNPHYYLITPVERCTTEELTTCEAGSTTTTTHGYLATVRFCNSASNANSITVPTGANASGLPLCQARYDANHLHPRYGQFERVDIVSSRTSYPKAAARTDCTGSTCTHTEEMTNFANWYAYYSTRMQLMKTGAGWAFDQVTDRFRVGLVTINPGSPVSSNRFLPVDAFTGTHRENWYTKLYAQTPSGYTPLLQALSRVGRYYGGKSDGINSGMTPDPVQYSCQQNFTILSTDGYWNYGARNDGTAVGQALDGGSIGNRDNVDSGYSTRADGAYDGGRATANNRTSSDTLADVALYYYQTDLRTETSGANGRLGTEVHKNNVPTSADSTDADKLKDLNSAQHMVTFTLGLGVDGLMRFEKDYRTSTSGDFEKIRDGASGTCSWVSGACDWPQVSTSRDSVTDQARIDDLWHAAVNGRGSYVSARDRSSLVEGIAQIVEKIRDVDGAAAAAATSAPLLTATDNYRFRSTFTTGEWTGELVADKLNPVDRTVRTANVWSAKGQLNTQTDRRILASNGTALVKFAHDTLDSAAKTVFENQCTNLTQCSTLSDADKAIANSPEHLIKFLSGTRTHETSVFRARAALLGDLAGSEPTVVGRPRRQYNDTGYTAFATGTAQVTRARVVLVGANDGMLHAFQLEADADGSGAGKELWAFVPRSVMRKMHKLADQSYGVNHEYFVDGTVVVEDVKIGDNWHTVAIGGLNAGGRGYYALDVTNPTSPSLLWEICADDLCSRKVDNMGQSFGNPVITKRPDGKWVALLTSGYNNVNPGDGKGYLYVVDIANGEVLANTIVATPGITTGAGTATAPSGLAKISAWVDDANTNNTSRFVYGGDLNGSLWRFDLSNNSVLEMATLRDGITNAVKQPITVRPVLSEIAGNRVVFVGTGRYLGVSDLQDPATLTPAGDWSYKATVYGLKDSGTSLGNPRSTLVESEISQSSDQIATGTRSLENVTVNWATENGWYADLPATGERVNVSPRIVRGTLVVASNVPSANSCEPGGTGWVTLFNARSGGQVLADIVDSKSKPGIIVGSNLLGTDASAGGGGGGGGGTDHCVTLADGSINCDTLPPGAGSTARRIGWREVPL